MKKVLSFVRKLVPFESIWLILIKTLTLNKMPYIDFLKLIERDGYSSERSCRSWWSTDCVSLHKLESLLQLERGKLHNSFIENAVPLASSGLNLKIRHCPQCIACNYHSSLFTLPYFTNCPWHFDELFDCASCGISVQWAGIDLVSSGDSSNLICKHAQSLSLQPYHKFSDNELSVVNHWCSEFVNWLSSADKIVAHDVLLALTASASLRRQVDLLFCYLKPRIGSPFSQFSNTEFPVIRVATSTDAVRWLQIRQIRRKKARSSFLRSECEASSIICDKDMIASAKSLRRFITKNFLNKHKKCFKRLRKLTHDQRLRLDFDCRCSCSIAYSCWLFQLLEVDKFSSVFAKKKRKYRSPRHVKGYPKSFFKIDLINCMVKFHSAWAAIEFSEREIPFSKLEIHCIGGGFRGVYNYSYFCSQPPSNASDDECSVSHYLVEPTYVNSCNLFRCKKVRGNNLSVSLVEAFQPEEGFNTNTAVAYKLYLGGGVSRDTFFVTVDSPRYPT